MRESRLIAALIVVVSRVAAADAPDVGASDAAEAIPDCVYIVTAEPAAPQCRFSTEDGYGACNTEVPTIGLETGFTALRYTPDGIDDSSSKYHLTAPGTQPVTMAGWRLRFYGMAGGGWYGGMEFDLAHADGPQLNASQNPPRGAAAASTMPMTTIDTSGDLVQTKLLVGKQARVGHFTAAVELAPGLQVATFSTIDAAPWNQSWYVLEAHAKLDLWFSRRTSLGIEASVDTLHSNRTELALLFGVHLDKH